LAAAVATLVVLIVFTDQNLLDVMSQTGTSRSRHLDRRDESSVPLVG
jgi:hypothetical protein